MSAQHRALVAAAHSLAADGFMVFPVRPGTKRPSIAGGFYSATRDHDEIDRIWSARRSHGVAIRTGRESRLLVLDVDFRSGGEESAALLAEAHGSRAETPLVYSGSGDGSFHEYFAHPMDAEIPCCKDLAGYAGIDIKGDRGYVVAPPSDHKSGGEYEWDSVFHFEDLPLAPAPSWLVELARSTERPPPQAFESVDWDGQVPPRVAQLVAMSPKTHRRFHRNPDELVDQSDSGIDFSLACILARFNCSGEEIEGALRASRAHARLDRRSPSYYASTVGKALTLAAEQEEAA